MKLGLETFLMFIGGILRLANIVSNIWYIFTQNFDSDLLYKLFIISLIAPSGVFLLIYTFGLLVDICSQKPLSSFKFFIFFLFFIGDSIGLNYFVFTFVLCGSNMIVGDFYVIDAMFRSSTLVNSLFQATPQIVIQVYNNQQIKNWNFLKIISIGVAGLSLIYTLTKLAYAIDKVKQYENACCITDRKNTGNKINIEITEHQKNNMVVTDHNKISNVNFEDEVYDENN